MKFHLTRYPSNENPTPILHPREDVVWEARAVFNPSVVYEDGLFRMLYRTYANTLKEAAPRLHRPGFFFTGQASYIGYAESNDGIHFERRTEPFIAPDQDFDRHGCEDPRITKIGDTFYITYTAIDSSLDDRKHRPNIRIALATTKDFITVTKHGIIGPPEDSKAAAFFPEEVSGGKTAFMLTVQSDSTNSHVSIRYFDSLREAMEPSEESWKDFVGSSMEQAVLKTSWWLDRGPELGAAPIKTERGWLLMYSAESMTDSWSMAAALLDLEHPHNLIARTPGSLLQAVTEYERIGLVDNVAFPEGAVVVGDELYVYYGCADTVIGLATCNLDELLDYVETFNDNH